MEGVAIPAAVFIGYALVSKRLTAPPITGPSVSVVAGVLLGSVGVFPLELSSSAVGHLLEMALVRGTARGSTRDV